MADWWLFCPGSVDLGEFSCDSDILCKFDTDYIRVSIELDAAMLVAYLEVINMCKLLLIHRHEFLQLWLRPVTNLWLAKAYSSLLLICMAITKACPKTICGLIFLFSQRVLVLVRQICDVSHHAKFLIRLLHMSLI